MDPLAFIANDLSDQETFGWRIHPDGHQRGVGPWQKIVDYGEGMIRQGDGAEANYRKPETLLFIIWESFCIV